MENSEEYWIANRRKGCSCKFCEGSFHANHEFSALIVGKRVRELEPDEVQLFDVLSNVLWCVRNPKCLVTHPEFSYEEVWRSKLKKKAMPTIAGAICKRCNGKNEYAEPNQNDGSYVCYECR